MPEIVVKLGDRVIQRYYFDKDVLSVGRARDNDIVIENLSVSRNHARIKRQDGKFTLVDMNSSNGTLVNGVRVTKADVAHNDEILIGKHTLLFLDTAQPSMRDTGTKEQGPPAAAAAAAAAAGPPKASQSRVPMPPPASASLPPPAAPPAPEPSTYLPEGVIGSLQVTRGKQQGHFFRVYAAETMIGRAPVNEVRVHDWLVSNKHAAIRRQNDNYFVRDLGSWRGTELNGLPLQRETQLKSGDVLLVGTTLLTFAIMDALAIPLPPPMDVPEPVRPPEDEPSSERQQKPAARSAEPIVRPGSDSARIPPKVEPNKPPPPKEDEFAPMTQDELEALEASADMVGDHGDEEAHRKEIWELTVAEKMFESDGDPDLFTLIEPEEELRAAEEAAAASAGKIPRVATFNSRDDMEMVEEELDEEEALYGGPISDDPPYGEPERVAVAPEPVATPVVPPPTKALPARTETPAPQQAAVRNNAPEAEIRLWEKALRNKSAIIRKNAAKELKKLTGIDYDWQSEPSSD